jgi:hypothetical protein
MKRLSIALLAWGMFTSCYAGEAATQAWEHILQVAPEFENPEMVWASVYADGGGGVVAKVRAEIIGAATTGTFFLWLDNNGQERWRSEFDPTKEYLIRDVSPSAITWHTK